MLSIPKGPESPFWLMEKQKATEAIVNLPMIGFFDIFFLATSGLWSPDQRAILVANGL